MSGTVKLVMVLGLGLLVANAVAGPQWQVLRDTLSGVEPK